MASEPDYAAIRLTWDAVVDEHSEQSVEWLIQTTVARHGCNYSDVIDMLERMSKEET